MPQNPIGDRSILVQVMAWCHQASNHYLSRCWPRSMWLDHNELNVLQQALQLGSTFVGGLLFGALPIVDGTLWFYGPQNETPITKYEANIDEISNDFKIMTLLATAGKTTPTPYLDSLIWNVKSLKLVKIVHLLISSTNARFQRLYNMRGTRIVAPEMAYCKHELEHAGLILGLRPANERWCYFVTTSLIGRSQAENHPWTWYFLFQRTRWCLLKSIRNRPKPLRWYWGMVIMQDTLYFCWQCFSWNTQN